MQLCPCSQKAGAGLTACSLCYPWQQQQIFSTHENYLRERWQRSPDARTAIAHAVHVLQRQQVLRARVCGMLLGAHLHLARVAGISLSAGLVRVHQHLHACSVVIYPGWRLQLHPACVHACVRACVRGCVAVCSSLAWLGPF